MLVSVAGSVGGIPPTAALRAAYNDTMDSEATGLLSTESPDPAKIPEHDDSPGSRVQCV